MLNDDVIISCRLLSYVITTSARDKKYTTEQPQRRGVEAIFPMALTRHSMKQKEEFEKCLDDCQGIPHDSNVQNVISGVLVHPKVRCTKPCVPTGLANSIIRVNMTDSRNNQLSNTIRTSEGMKFSNMLSLSSAELKQNMEN